MKFKEFNEIYGIYYSDPEAAYAALKNYEKENNGESCLINRSYINSYDKYIDIYGYSSNSPLGFEQFMFSREKNQVPTAHECMAIYNDYIRGQLSRYANLLALNPLQEQIIDDQFLFSVGSDLNSTPETDDENSKRIFNLMNTVKSIVFSHDGSSNFSFNKAESVEDLYANGQLPNSSMALFYTDDEIRANIDENGKLENFSFMVSQLSYNYDEPTESGFEERQDTLNDSVRFNVYFPNPTHDHCSFGQR